MHMLRRALLLSLAALALWLPAGRAAPGDAEIGYRQIDAEGARALMDDEEAYLLVDVRTQAEYDAGHIPGAILLPNETIGREDPALLPDKAQRILVYCRSGNRSKQAAEKLVAMGYTDVYEFGGILDWPYEVVPSEAPDRKDTP